MQRQFIETVIRTLEANGCRLIASTNDRGKGHPVARAEDVSIVRTREGTQYATLIVEHSGGERCQVIMLPSRGKAWSPQSYGLGETLNSVLTHSEAAQEPQQ